MALTPLLMRRSIADGPVFGSPCNTAICAPCGRCGSTGTNFASSSAVTTAIPIAPNAQTTSEMFIGSPELKFGAIYVTDSHDRQRPAAWTARPTATVSHADYLPTDGSDR